MKLKKPREEKRYLVWGEYAHEDAVRYVIEKCHPDVGLS